jgi:glycosyltransferase involved in cell wall biosynthesis
MPVMFSIVMASHLGQYPGCAGNRESKFLRAVESLLFQDFTDWELIVVADGCKRTGEILGPRLHPQIRLIELPKAPIWCPSVRNAGIEAAEGKYIHYLDTDDYYGRDHLSDIVTGLEEAGMPPWAWFNDLVWDPLRKVFKERHCDPNKRNQHGTSNFVHQRSLGVKWPGGGYAHDATFAQALKAIPGGVRIGTPAYCVCHIPSKYDV